MNILKKIAGYVLFIISGLIIIAIIKTFFNALIETSAEIKQSLSGGIAYFLGCLVVIVLAILLVRFIWKVALKLIDKKSVSNDSLDEIGKTEL